MVTIAKAASKEARPESVISDRIAADGSFSTPASASRVPLQCAPLLLPIATRGVQGRWNVEEISISESAEGTLTIKNIRWFPGHTYGSRDAVYKFA